MKSRRYVLIALAAGAALLGLPAFAQQERRVKRIGFLGAGALAVNANYLAAFRQGMSELRWIDGRDYSIDARSAENVVERVSALAAELVATQPDLLLTTSDPAIRALSQVTKSIPIVFGIAADPVASGFAQSLQRPGANMTGMTNLTRELGPKRLELLRDAVQGITHIAVLFEPANTASLTYVKDIEQAAPGMRMRVTRMELRGPSDIGPAFKRGAVMGIKACLLTQSPMITAQFRTIAEIALKFRIPAIAGGESFVETGGLMAYGPSAVDNFRRAASYADKILKGAKAGDLPIEQPVKFNLIVNMKTAKAMGIALPQSILLRADRVIE